MREKNVHSLKSKVNSARRKIILTQVNTQHQGLFKLRMNYFQIFIASAIQLSMMMFRRKYLISIIIFFFDETSQRIVTSVNWEVQKFETTTANSRDEKWGGVTFELSIFEEDGRTITCSCMRNVTAQLDRRCCRLSFWKCRFDAA